MQQPKDIIDRLNIVFYAMIGLPMLLFAWVYLPLKDILDWQEFQALWRLGIWSYVMAAVIVLLAVRELRSTDTKFQDVDKDWPLPSKLLHFSRTFRRSFMVVMLLSLLSVGFLYLTRNQLFVLVYALLLFLVSLYRPSLQRFRRHLPLTKEELETIKN